MTSYTYSNSHQTAAAHIMISIKYILVPLENLGPKKKVSNRPPHGQPGSWQKLMMLFYILHTILCISMVLLTLIPL